jgi:hypothetical protein
MTKTLFTSLALFSLLCSIVSCDKPVCKNTNTVFDKYSPVSKEYKDELVRQMARVDKSKLTYWIDNYQEDNHLQYILAQIQGDGLCAKIVLVVNDSEKGIEGIIKSKGIGYRGAELEDLKFSIKQDSTSTEFVFQEISGIVD